MTQCASRAPLLHRNTCSLRCEREHHGAGGDGAAGPRGERTLPTPAGLHGPHRNRHHQGGNVPGDLCQRWGRQRTEHEWNRHGRYCNQLLSAQGEESSGIKQTLMSYFGLFYFKTRIKNLPLFSCLLPGWLVWLFVCLRQGLNSHLSYRPDSKQICGDFN